MKPYNATFKTEKVCNKFKYHWIKTVQYKVQHQ